MCIIKLKSDSHYIVMLFYIFFIREIGINATGLKLSLKQYLRYIMVHKGN